MDNGTTRSGTEETLRAAGVDPKGSEASEWRALIGDLLERGATPDDLARAVRAGDLESLVNSVTLWGGQPRVTIAEVADGAGLSEDTVRTARRLLGFADPGDDSLCRTEEVEAFRALAGGIALFGEDDTLQFSRVLGTASAMIAEAAIALFASALGGPMLVSGVREIEYATTIRDATASFHLVCRAVDVLLRLHFDTAIARIGRAARTDDLPFGIAFVDLIDSTVLARELQPAELASALRDFDRMAIEAAARHDVRLVKLIGDGAMLAARDPAVVRDAVVDVLDAAGVHPLLRGARGGLAYGPVTVRDGDYFGSVVNLAARAAGVAGDGELLVDGNAARMLADDESAGVHALKGFDAPVRLFRARRGR